MHKLTYGLVSVIYWMLLFTNLCSSQEKAMGDKSGTTSQEQATRATIDRFNDAFNRHDADSLAGLLTEDTVFEDTSPAPDGRRVEGKHAVVEFWRAWFEKNTDARFEAEEIIVSGNRATVLWVYHKSATVSPGTCGESMSSP